MDASATLDNVRDWPVEDQLELVFQLWDQITDNRRPPTPSPELLTELHRRLDAHAADPGRAVTWEQVVAHATRTR